MYYSSEFRYYSAEYRYYNADFFFFLTIKGATNDITNDMRVWEVGGREYSYYRRIAIAFGGRATLSSRIKLPRHNRYRETI